MNDAEFFDPEIDEKYDGDVGRGGGHVRDTDIRRGDWSEHSARRNSAASSILI